MVASGLFGSWGGLLGVVVVLAFFLENNPVNPRYLYSEKYMLLLLLLGG